MLALFHTLVARARGFLRPGAMDADFDQELAEHLAMAEEDGVRRGLTREEARRLARVQLGGLTQLREAGRAAWGLPWLGACWLDVKLGVRLLVKYPALTLVSTLALAVAIAIVAGFHAGTEFMVRPTLPVPEGGRMVAIWNHDVRASDRGEQMLGDMLAWRRELVTLQDVGAFVARQRVVAAANGATRLVRAVEISPSAFQTVRIPPLLGRPLVEEDERLGGPAVVVLGFDVWQSAAGGDEAIIGETIRVGGIEHTVVGVMPAEFRFPRSEQLWTPLRVPSAGLAPGEGARVEFTVARLAPDVTLEEAEAELEVVASRIAADHPNTHGHLRPRISSYARSFIEANEPGLVVMMGAAQVSIGLVLLVVAVNVGALVYARNAARVGEVALRTALGAGRPRIILQMFLEALVLSSLAAALGLAIMAWPLSWLREALDTVAAQGDALPFWFDVRLGPRTLLLVAGLVLLSAVLTGVLPAVKLTERGMRAALRHVQAGVSGLRFGRAATVVVISQVALSVALLVVGASQLSTFVEDWIAFEDRVIAREEYLGAQLRWDLATSPGAAGILPEEVARRATIRATLGFEVGREPNVRGATFYAFDGVRPVVAEGPLAAAAPLWAWIVSVEPNYFDVYDTPVIAGRAFDAADVSNAAAVAIVNEAFVRTVLASDQAVGQRIRPIDPQGGRPVGESLEIVGVARDIHALEISQRGPGWVAFPTVYVPLGPTPLPVTMTVRLHDDPARFGARLQAIAAAIDPTMVVHQPRPFEETDRVSWLFVRLYGFGVGVLVFAVVVLSIAGVNAMMSFTVAQRTREIGIRAALGAAPGRLIGDVFSRALLQLGVGIALGLWIGYIASAGPFALSEGLFDHGPEAMAAVALGVLVMGLTACWAPLRRALGIQPTEALRADG